MKKGLKILLWTSGIILLLIPASYFLLDYAIRSAVSSTVKEAENTTGREITVRSIDTEPYTITAILHDLEVKTPDRKAVFVSISTARVSKSLSSYWKGATILNELNLQAPRIHIARMADGSFNFSDILNSLKKKEETTQPPPEAAKQPEKKNTAFSISDISVTNGLVTFKDKAAPGGAVNHTVRRLDLSVPWISNIPNKSDKPVNLRMQAVVNGSPFSLAGSAKPFADPRSASLQLSLDRVALPFYAQYIPEKVPVAVESGTLSLGLGISYSGHQHAQPAVNIGGKMTLQDLLLKYRDPGPLLAVGHLTADIRSTDLAARAVNLDLLRIDSFDVYVRRSANGVWSYRRLTRALEQMGRKKPSPAEEKKKQVTARVALTQVRNGRVHFRDASVSPHFRTDIRDITIDMKGLDTTRGATAPIDLSLHTGKGEKVALSGSVSASPPSFDGKVSVSGICLSDYYPYFTDYLTAPVRGTVESSAHLMFNTASDEMQVSNMDLQVADMYTPFGGEDFAKLGAVRVKDATYDGKRNTAAVAGVFMRGGKVRVTRQPDGSLTAMNLLKEKPQKEERAAAKKQDRNKLKYSVKKVSLSGLDFQVQDQATHSPKPAHIRLHGLAAEVRDISGPGFPEMPYRVSAHIGNDGSIKLRGSVMPKPLKLKVRVELNEIPLTDFAPYAARYDLDITDGLLGADLRANISKTGSNLEGNCRGDLNVKSFRLQDPADRSTLVLWELLRLEGVRGNFQPPAFFADRVLLNDYFANVVVNRDGTVNFRRVIAEAEGNKKAKKQPGQSKTKPNVRINDVTLENGVLDFKDYSLDPRRYATRFVQLGGRISGLSSKPGTRADVDLRGSLENQSPLRISGKMNPLADPLYVDLKVDFDNVALPRFSPYAAKYLGYRIEQGKLRATLDYKIEDKKIEASNRILIDQLFFGREVESEQAYALPGPVSVPTAVGLLKGPKGRIELDVPVTGSMQGPDIAVGTVVWEAVKKAFKGLFRKMISNPFSFLFGTKSEEFKIIYFDYGSPALTDKQKQKLVALARKMEERPELRLDVTGYVDRDRDAEGYRRYLLNERMRMAKYLDRLKGQQQVPQTGHVPENIQITPEDSHEYLKRVYEQSDFPKPETIFGNPKELPDGEMRKLLLAHTVIGERQLRELSRLRSLAVRDFLAKREKIDPSRLFLRIGDINKQAEEQAKSNARVEFSLASREGG